MALNLNKDLKMFYSIGEVAAQFNVNETTLRYWEKEFPQLAPEKKGGVRRYSKADLEQVGLIHNLVKVRGLKIAAAREAMKKSRTKTVRRADIISRLMAVSSELKSLKAELDGLE
ncbi:MAG: MerR family transcriptional regulator [Bacteroidales bacterium]|nr:MerR family transcriptional regulator [Bacteroidales bacterium]